MQDKGMVVEASCEINVCKDDRRRKCGKHLPQADDKDEAQDEESKGGIMTKREKLQPAIIKTINNPNICLTFCNNRVSMKKRKSNFFIIFLVFCIQAIDPILIISQFFDNGNRICPTHKPRCALAKSCMHIQPHVWNCQYAGMPGQAEESNLSFPFLPNRIQNQTGCTIAGYIDKFDGNFYGKHCRVGPIR
jgi:hypothetical protein